MKRIARTEAALRGLSSKKTFGPSLVILVAVSALAVLGQTSPAPAAGSPAAADKGVSPAARRAFVRDSLRQERLKARANAAQTAPEAPTTGGNPNPAVQPPPSTPPQATVPQNTPPIPPSGDRQNESIGNASLNAVFNPSAGLAPVSQDTAPAGAAAAEAPAKPVELPISDSIMVKSLNVRNTEIRDVLQGLGIQYSVNILMAPDVTGPVTVNLTKIKLKEALRLIAEENGYALSVVHGAVKVEKRPAPKPVAPPAPRFKVVFEGNKLSVDLQKIPSDQAIRRLTEVTGRNIVLDQGSAAEMTGFFKDMELRKGLNLLAETNGMSVREKDGVYSFYREAWSSGGREGQGAAASGRMRVTVKDKLVSLEVTGAPLSDIISSISAQTGISTVVYGELKGTVTMRVSDLPIEQAFQILFRGTEFTFWMHEGIYFIGPQTMQVLNNSKLIVLKHMKVDDVMELLPASLTKDAQLKAVKSQNAIMVMGTYEVIDGMGQYISQIDLPVPQILIEALVVDVDMDRIRQYGVDMFMGDAKRVPSSEHIYPNIDQVFNKSRSQDAVDLIPGVRDIVSLPKNFVAQIQALEQEKALKIRSRPQIATLNGSEATITVGQTQYFLLKSETDFSQGQGVTAKTSERFEKIEANVTLTVTPFVTGQGEITCDIVPDFSEPEGSFDSRTPPTLNRRVLKSKVRLRDGETIVLGGLVKESINRTTRQFPFLGSIPVIGWLFKNVSDVKSRSQLMIFVTPHVYYGKDANVDPNKYLKKQSDLDQ
jgi:type II secretory pathway component GspD/PulD (secretin)